MWMPVLLSTLLATSAAASDAGSTWAYPVQEGRSAVIQPFERPVDRFAAGHRGVDLAADEAEPVRAIGAGVVTFVGEVAGTPSVTIDHGVVRSSYLPVAAEVSRGQRVRAGEIIGTLTAGHCPSTCLHLGLRRPIWDRLDHESDPYLDPIAWISPNPVLKPIRPAAGSLP